MFSDFDGFENIERDPRIFFWTSSAILSFDPSVVADVMSAMKDPLDETMRPNTVRAKGVDLQTQPSPNLPGTTDQSNPPIDLKFSTETSRSIHYSGEHEFIAISAGHLVRGDYENPSLTPSLVLMEIKWSEGVAYRVSLAGILEEDWIKLARTWEIFTLA
jgi:hypothetical protein